MPICLAVPSTIRQAASGLVVFKSGILILAISSICFLLTLPTFVCRALEEPFSMPAAFFNNSAAGGVFKTKEKVLSS